MPSDNSIKLYKRLLEKVRHGVAPRSVGLSFLADHAETIKWIEAQALSINSKKAIYIALKSTLRDAAESHLNDAEKAYERQMLSYRDEHNAIAVQQKLSPRESELFVEWPHVIDGGDKVWEDVSTLWEYQDAVIYSLYTLQAPLRLDYSPMRVVYSVDDLSGCTDNALVWDHAPRFYLQNYKTANKYGKIFIEVSPALEEVLEEWLQLQDSGWLLLNYGGTEPLDENGLASRIKHVFEMATGKPLGVSMLRHSYITYMRRGEMPAYDQQRMAAAMCHSSAMSQMYRRI